MKRKWLILVLVVFSLLNFTLVSYAKTSGEYINDIYKLIDKKQFNEAFVIVHKGIEEYPGNVGLIFAKADICYHKKDYETAIVNYLSILKAGPTDKENLIVLHSELIGAYNELGQKHYFSKELCSRMIYHLEKYLELDLNPPKKDERMDFLRKSIGHFNVAIMGVGNVKMMESGGDGAEFQLPEDNISIDEKMRYKDIAIQRLEEYDALRKESSFRTVGSDKTIEDMIQLINQRTSAIKTIHFKMMNTVNGVNVLLEEITYKSPDRIKIVEPNAISVISNVDYYVLNPHTNKIIQQDRLDPAKQSLLKGVGFYNLREASEAFNLTIEKIVGCPDFLSEICKDSSTVLYLITGSLKNGDDKAYSPIIKVEYFIDGQTGLCLSKREYWPGVLGEGKKEELAKESVVTKIEKHAEGIFLASIGKTSGYVEELANLKEDWMIDVLSINQEIRDQEFSVFK